jgi:hypothetical protein
MDRRNPTTQQTDSRVVFPTMPDLNALVKAYDIRGIVPDQLDADVAYAIGVAFAKFANAPHIVIAHDMRPSGPELVDAFQRGVVAHGVSVTNLGLASSDLLYYASGKLDSPGAEVNMYGVYLADTGNYFEHRPYVDHIAENCVSNVAYKGALKGSGAHTVWVGDVLIRESAVGTDTYELNRNLLLVDGARADSVPNLEIETGKIAGAGHASASGRFDDLQLFYLMARGIDESTAKKLVVRGFLSEIIQKIGIEEVEQRLIAVIEAELEKAGN